MATTAMAQASSYFTVGENDTVRIKPYSISTYLPVPVRAHFESRFDFFSIQIQHPSHVVVENPTPGKGMTIHYTNKQGLDTIYSANLTFDDDALNVSSSIPVFGYWDIDGDHVYDPYGTVKWEAGDYDEMFLLHYFINTDCTGDSLVLDGEMTSTMDWRGGTGNAMFHKKIFFVVGYIKGDVNGDGRIDVSDVTTLISYVLGNEPDNFILEAANVNGDGNIDVSDVTRLIAMILS